MIYFDEIRYLFAFKVTGGTKHLLEEEGRGPSSTATLQPDKRKLTLSGPPRCHPSMLMSWGPLSVGATQAELQECLNHAWTCSSLRRNGGKCV